MASNQSVFTFSAADSRRPEQLCTASRAITGAVLRGRREPVERPRRLRYIQFTLERVLLKGHKNWRTIERPSYYRQRIEGPLLYSRLREI